MHRDRFEPGKGIYLLSHSVGLPPKTARAAANGGFFDPWDDADPDVWTHWLTGIDRFRSALASLLKGQPENYCPQVNLSSALTKIIDAIPREAGRGTIVYSEADFPSLGFVLAMAERTGYELRCIPGTSDFGALDCWEAAVDDGCSLVLVTHVHSNTSTQVPVGDICELARQRGARTIVDIAQSVGIVPIDLTRWDADFVLGSCVKFLCGGPGAGFMWVNDRALDDCHPRDVGWFSHADPFEFDIHDFRYADSALRFWGGTPSILPYVVAANSIELLDEVGIDAIRANNLALTQYLVDRVGDQYLATPRDADRRGGTVVLNFRNQQPAVEEKLRRAGVQFDSRPAGVRLSPHIYNTHEEMETVMTCLPTAGR